MSCLYWAEKYTVVHRIIESLKGKLYLCLQLVLIEVSVLLIVQPLSKRQAIVYPRQQCQTHHGR